MARNLRAAKQPAELAGPLDVDMETLGERLRRLRRTRRLTLKEVADAADLSPSLLSMLERGEVADISLSRFSRLARVYGLRTSDLLLEDRENEPPVAHTLKQAALVPRGAGVTYRLLPGSPASMQLMHVVFEPRAGFAESLIHEGEDFVYVIRGEVTIQWGNHQLVVGEEGFITYPGTVRHSVFNAADQVAELIAFTTKPFW
jgi:transcriptional regulator with XRE-family HTH domain